MSTARDGIGIGEMSSVGIDNNDVLKRRLQFPRDVLFGREDELNQLFQVYRRLCGRIDNNSFAPDDIDSESSMAEMVLISGYSGTGKSSLVDQFRERLKPILESKNTEHPPNNALLEPLWISGVFEDKKTEPFSAVASAFSGYCVQLSEENNSEELHRVSTGIKEVIGKEGRVLTDVIPELALLIGEQPEASTTSTNEDSLNRLLFLFQSIVDVICRRKSPVILFLDDLQRADAASLDLIAALMTVDSACLGNRLMFIGCMRSNEVDKHHALSESLKMIHEKRQKKSKEIEVSNLPREAINHFISTTLSLDPNDTQSLTDAVYSKTEGNIFFTKQSLEQLNDKQVLNYDMINSHRWIWDVERISQELALSDNVLEVITARIAKFPSRLQMALTVAAFLRSSFDLSIIEEFMETDYVRNGLLGESQYYDYDLVELLDIAVTEGLLENDMGSTTYKFKHDRIQQAAYSLVPMGSASDELRIHLGAYLLERASSEGGKEWMLFVAADLLNATSTTVPLSVGVNSIDLAKLNLAVGERAMSQSAFRPASCYFLKGLKALERSSLTPWQSHYDLALALHCSASNTELSIGDFDVGWRLAHIVLRRARSLSEKLRTYMSLVDALGRQQKSAEAIRFVKEALEQLGDCPHPKRPKNLHILREFFAIKKIFSRFQDDEILRLPKMVDTEKRMTMELLSQLTQRSYLCGDRASAGLSVFRQLKLTFQYGLCGASAHALSCYGVMLCSTFKDHVGGQRLGRLAKEVLYLTKEERFKSRTLKLCAVFIDPWSVPLASVMNTLSVAHVSGLETGTFEHGFRAFFDFQVIAYATGTTLGKIEKDCMRMRGLMEQYGVGPTLSIFEEFLVLIVSLTGTEKNKDWRSPFPVHKDQDTYFRYSWYCFTRMQLAFLFDEITLADEMSRLVLPLVEASDRCFVYISHVLYFSALIAAAMAINKGRGRYWARAQQLRRKLNNHIVRTKPMNMLHKYLIVEAQYKATFSSRRKDADIRDAFDNAISASARSGFTQDAAIANELAGEYFLREKDKFWARHYLTNAHQKYHDWGAGAKVQHLLRKYHRWIDTSGCLESATCPRKHAVLGEACDKHRAVDLDSLSGFLVPSSSIREHD